MASNTLEPSTDDAPATTSKRGDAEGVGRSVTINRPRQELYDYWRNLAHLPNVLENVERIEVLNATRSHWVVKAPGGGTVEWDSVITEDRSGALIAWVSEEGAEVANSGRIRFADAGARGTVVTALLSYDPPAGIIGKTIAKMFQREPAIQARRDLRRFKQLMETGEISTNARNRAELEAEKE